MSEFLEIPLADMDAWHAFAIYNRKVLLREYGTTERALRHATDGGLVVSSGGGRPLHVFFIEADNEDASTITMNEEAKIIAKLIEWNATVGGSESQVWSDAQTFMVRRRQAIDKVAP